MSYTSLWEIDKNWSGRAHSEYKNSWLFCPTIWDVLMCKYISPCERYSVVTHAEITSYLSWSFSFDREIANIKFKKLNERINNSPIQSDRVLWELSNLSVFNAKDKLLVCECIKEFVENNIVGNSEYTDCEHIIERFLEIAESIKTLPKRCRYFVIHPTSCDDNVEWWFNRKRLCSWDKFVCEFTLIENGKVVGFSTNLEMCRKECGE